MSTINFDKSEDRPEEIVRQLIGVLKMVVGDADVVAIGTSKRTGLRSASAGVRGPT